MKKTLKILGYGLGTLLLVVVISLLFINTKGIPRYEVQAKSLTVHSTAKSVARGKKLAMTLCAHCHFNSATGKFSGKHMAEVPPEFGKVFSANITSDSTYGIGSYTAGELAYLLRTGVARDGRYLPPYMAKLPNMAHEDIEAIISFLHSADPLVQPYHVADTATEPSLLTKVLCYTMFKPLPEPEAIIPMPDSTDKIGLGRYLAVNLECFSCHSQDFKTNNFLEPEKSPGYFAGGNKPLNQEGKVMLTPNLTFHETGIKTWTEAQFIQAVKYGQRPGKPALRYPMMPFVLLTDYEAGAIYQYLKTIPAIDNSVPANL